MIIFESTELDNSVNVKNIWCKRVKQRTDNIYHKKSEKKIDLQKQAILNDFLIKKFQINIKEIQ